jgi:hypothetical protein
MELLSIVMTGRDAIDVSLVGHPFDECIQKSTIYRGTVFQEEHGTTSLSTNMKHRIEDIGSNSLYISQI